MKTAKNLTIDLKNQKITDDHEHEYHFDISSFSKKRLVENLSDLDYLLGFEEEIKKFANK